MEISETLDFMDLLQEAYPNFRLTPPLLDYWQQALKTLSKDDIYEALRQYVSDAPHNYPPTINRLLDLSDRIREQRRRERSRKREPVEEILERAAGQAPATEKEWTREHLWIIKRLLNHSMAREEIPSYCLKLADKYPKDAMAWVHVARDPCWAKQQEGDAHG